MKGEKIRLKPSDHASDCTCLHCHIANVPARVPRQEPIRVGDKFRCNGKIYEVIETKPGGVVELFDALLVRFCRTYVRDIRRRMEPGASPRWERVS